MVLAATQPGAEQGLTAVHIEAGGISSIRALTARGVIKGADITLGGEWIALTGEPGKASLQDQVSSVIAASADGPVHTFDGGVRGLALFAPDIVSLVDAQGPRVLVGASRALELPACRPPPLAQAPHIAPFPGGLVVVQRCVSGLVVSRHSTGPAPDITTELPGSADTFDAFDAVVDGDGRLIIAWWPPGQVPFLSILRVDDLMPARDPEVLSGIDCARETRNPGRVRLEADPTRGGRYAALLSRPSGHGEGCASLVRLELCGSE
ncbi:MAG: hypothetical protein SFW67_08495 [Myxococcaceae bacterium]|nr:hypothetical protein [Myxococcaceae bacterium]